MYPKPRFLEVLHAIREEMSREADYDVELFAETARSGERPRRERNSRVRTDVSDVTPRRAERNAAREDLRPKRTA